MSAPKSGASKRQKRRRSVKKAVQPIRWQCDFAAALLKGLVEHSDGTKYFGSLGGYRFYLIAAKERGWVVRTDGKSDDETFDDWRIRATEKGLEAYSVLHLDWLPRVGRAYMWDWSITTSENSVEPENKERDSVDR